MVPCRLKALVFFGTGIFAPSFTDESELLKVSTGNVEIYIYIKLYIYVCIMYVNVF